MTTFVQTIQPTSFGFFDDDPAFQSEADKIAVFVKRKLGDDVLQVELTKKQIWTCFEEACCEYSRLVHEMRTTSELVNVLGLPTGSTDLTNKYPRVTLEYLMRQAEPYASYADVGGSYDATLGYFDLRPDVQDYNIYTELKDAASGSNIYESLPSGSKGKLRIIEVFHFEPLAAQHFLLNASNVTNFLATSFNYESYVNSTVFYVLPVFEDILRRGMLEQAFRVRRSNYSYQIIGSNLRIYPIPNSQLLDAGAARLYVKVSAGIPNPLAPSGIGTVNYGDDSINGISGPNNIPLGNLPFVTITQPGRQWIRQYTLALCKEVLGLTRSKLKTIPVPNAELQLNGEDLLAQSKEEKDKLSTQLKEFLANLTTQKLMEAQSAQAESINKQLKYVAFPGGKAIIIG